MQGKESVQQMNLLMARENMKSIVFRLMLVKVKS